MEVNSNVCSSWKYLEQNKTSVYYENIHLLSVILFEHDSYRGYSSYHKTVQVMMIMDWTIFLCFFNIALLIWEANIIWKTWMRKWESQTVNFKVPYQHQKHRFIYISHVIPVIINTNSIHYWHLFFSIKFWQGCSGQKWDKKRSKFFKKTGQRD